jgi:hypothetical protein
MVDPISGCAVATNSRRPSRNALHVFDFDIVEEALGAGEDHHDLLLDRVGRVLTLLEELDEACPAVEGLLRRLVEVRAELCERGKLAVLREVETERTGDRFIALICAEPPTRETEMPTLIAGRTPWKNRSVCRKI